MPILENDLKASSQKRYYIPVQLYYFNGKPVEAELYSSFYTLMNSTKKRHFVVDKQQKFQVFAKKDTQFNRLFIEINSNIWAELTWLEDEHILSSYNKNEEQEHCLQINGQNVKALTIIQLNKLKRKTPTIEILKKSQRNKEVNRTLTAPLLPQTADLFYITGEPIPEKAYQNFFYKHYDGNSEIRYFITIYDEYTHQGVAKQVFNVYQQKRHNLYLFNKIEGFKQVTWLKDQEILSSYFFKDNKHWVTINGIDELLYISPKKTSIASNQQELTRNTQLTHSPTLMSNSIILPTQCNTFISHQIDIVESSPEYQSFLEEQAILTSTINLWDSEHLAFTTSQPCIDPLLQFKFSQQEEEMLGCVINQLRHEQANLSTASAEEPINSPNPTTDNFVNPENNDIEIMTVEKEQPPKIIYINRLTNGNNFFTKKRKANTPTKEFEPSATFLV